jgi:hypothetical protein
MMFTLEDISPSTEHMLQKAHEEHSKNPFVWFIMGVETILKNSMNLTLNHKKDHIVFHGAPHSSMKTLGVVIRQDGYGYNAPMFYRRATRAAVCKLYHKIFDTQGGEIDTADWQEWARIKGRINYAELCRFASDAGYDGADPTVQKRFFKPLEVQFAAAKEVQRAASQGA